MPEEIFLMIILVIGWLTAVGLAFQSNRWHNKYDKAVDAWGAESDECDRKDKQIEALENELKTHKGMERVVKVEKVIMQPRELECIFMLHERFVDDTELFKKVLTSEVARYMAEELENDPYLCKIYHDRNSYHQEHIKVRFRMLPYAEGVAWDDIFKEEK